MLKTIKRTSVLINAIFLFIIWIQPELHIHNTKYMYGALFILSYTIQIFFAWILYMIIMLTSIHSLSAVNISEQVKQFWSNVDNFLTMISWNDHAFLPHAHILVYLVSCSLQVLDIYLHFSSIFTDLSFHLL